MESGIDIIDWLQEEEGYVKLFLASGETVCGRPQCIIYDEDDEGWETVKKIMFRPWGWKISVWFGLDEVVSYERIDKSDLPQ